MHLTSVRLYPLIPLVYLLAVLILEARVLHEHDMIRNVEREPWGDHLRRVSPTRLIIVCFFIPRPKFDLRINC